MRPRFLIPSLLLALAAAACGESAPRYTLQQVMLEMDHQDKQLAAAVGGGGVDALAAARSLERWSRDPAFEVWLRGGSVEGDPDLFRQHRAHFEANLQGLLAALVGPGTAEAPAVYARMRMSCELCHRDFRPEVPLAIGSTVK